MDDALTGLDAYLERPQPADYDRDGCRWCGDDTSDAPCSVSCEEAAEDDYITHRRAALRLMAESCYRARTRAFGLAARYILEGDALASRRVSDARAHAVAWQMQGDEAMSKARTLGAREEAA